ncbi:MAG TPA: PQQ-binding-like beta-propeller repeat protein [Candidatus Polarisedimenticolia bacterium]|nr:PQQ-binding-like beta-propeller repeat protein [Candidatus Polarisedimenticolia bacterium]
MNLVRETASLRLRSLRRLTPIILAFCSCLLFALSSVPSGIASQAAKSTATSPGDSQRLEAGKKLYARSCGFCHGPEGKGGSAPALADRSLVAADLTSVIANGKPGTTMPAFKNTASKEDIANLVAYILSLSPRGAAAKRAKPAATEAAVSAETGEAIYAKRCAYCHESGGPPFLNRAALKPASPEYTLYMLSTGAMHAEGRKLIASQRAAVAAYIAGRPLGRSRGAAISADRCSHTPSASFSGPQWDGWGNDFESTRFQPAAAAGLPAEEVPKLKLKWAFGFPGEFGAYTQPTVAGGRVFASGPLGDVYSLDASTGCTYWHFKAAAGVRSAVLLGPGHRAYVGDFQANVYAVNAVTGKLVWKTRVSTHPYARVSGTLQLYKGRLYVPVASREEWMAVDPRYDCCTFRGFLVALDAATGKVIWKTYTIADPPKPTHKTALGSQKYGPSGAGLWSSPTIDTKRQLLYIGAGNNYTDPPTPNSDAILAFDLKTGKIVWSRQITEGDAYNISCFREDKSNCPAKPGPDSDFGSSPMLYTLAGGRQVLVVAQKSGVVFGLDPDNKGAILWETRIGKGGPLGGIEWGPAATDGVVYVALSDLGFASGPEGMIPDPKAGGGLFAIDIATGKQLWSVLPSPDACGAIPRCSPAQMAAITAIPGVVFSGAYDGHLRAYSMKDGKILWDYDTAHKYDAVNKIPAYGGAIDGGGPAVAGGMVFVNSGYAAVNGMPGNVLLAFAPE